jgi:hypothetical protein
MVLLAAAGVNAQTIKLGNVEQVYSDEQLNNKTTMNRVKSLIPDASGNFIIDAPFCTIRKSNTEMYFFVSSWQGIDRCVGTPQQPLQSRDWGKSRDALWTNPMIFVHDVDPQLGPYWRDEPWISNVYKYDNGNLLGFVHVECSQVKHNESLFYQTCIYKIGLAYSTNNGEQWTYCGDIIFTKDRIGPWWTTYPCNGFVCPGNGLNNIEGVPYIVISDSFYVYFIDYDYSVVPAGRICVAKAKVSDVVERARKIPSDNLDVNALCAQTPWKKFDGTAWSIDAASTTQAGASIVNLLSGAGFDIHGDAAFCKPLQRYLLTINTGDDGRLLLYSSKDGLDWNTTDPIELDNIQGWRMPHSFFASLGPDASDDNHDVGKEFYIVWPRTSSAYGTIQTLHRRKIEIVSDTVPAK